MTNATVQTTEAGRTISDKEGKYLTFALGQEEYGLEILKVREIIGYMDITAVPQTPDYVKGVINLRGQVIPVIDLRRKFGMEPAEPTEQTCIIVVEISHAEGAISTGIVVDRVSEVLDITADQIRAFLADQDELSAKTLLNYHTGLSALWTWAIKEKIVERNIVRDVDPPKPEQPAIEPYSRSDIREMMAAIGESASYKRDWDRRRWSWRPLPVR